MAIALLFLVFALLLVAGVPVAYALSAAALATLLYLDLPSIVLVQQTASGAGTASLIAIPRRESQKARQSKNARRSVFMNCTDQVCPPLVVR